MNLTCQRCQVAFEAPTFLGYCPDCVKAFREHRQSIGRAHNPSPGIHLDGQFTNALDLIARSFENPVSKAMCCGLCGGASIHSGFGLGTGYGMAAYNFCEGCGTFVDIVPDNDDE